MDDTTDRIDRREALRRTATLLGGVLSAPTIAGVLAGDTRAWAATPDAAWTPRTLGAAQSELVATLAEHIIPATDTPGARAAGVHRFVDALLAAHYSAHERDRFLAGLEGVDVRARQRFGASFLRCTARQQHDILVEMDAAAYPARAQVAQTGRAQASPADPADTAGVADAVRAELRSGWFWRRMKELTLTGYYTSQIGATRELHVNPMGVWRGDISYQSVGRSWA